MCWFCLCFFKTVKGQTKEKERRVLESLRDGCSWSNKHLSNWNDVAVDLDFLQFFLINLRFFLVPRF